MIQGSVSEVKYAVNQRTETPDLKSVERQHGPNMIRFTAPGFDRQGISQTQGAVDGSMRDKTVQYNPAYPDGIIRGTTRVVFIINTAAW